MRKVFVLFSILPTFLLAQTNLSQKQLKYLYDAGRLWGNVKYFHPYLQYKNINWDSSFAAAVPQILNCKSANDYATVLQTMFNVLDDNVTYASFTNNKTKTSAHYINTEKGKAWLHDGILIMRLNDKAIADDYNETVKVTSATSNLLDSAKAIVFDLRQTEKGSRLSDPGEMNYEFKTGNYTYRGLNSMLCSSLQSLPAERFMVHKGFKPEGTRGSDAYQPFFETSHANTVNGLRKKPLTIVFLVNENIALPAVAIALQKSGNAIILAEGAHMERNAVASINYTIDSVNINLRKSELTDENGLLSVQEDSLLTPQTDYNVNLQLAIAIAAGPVNPVKKNTNIPGSYTGQWKRDSYNTTRYPDIGYRVLAAAKIYSVIHFFNPDKDLFDNNWDSVYLKYLPQFITAKDSVGYMKAIAGMYSNVQDSHGFAWDALPYAWDTLFGTAAPPCIRTTKVEHKMIVSLIVDEAEAKKEGFEKGDIILSVNGRDPAGIIKEAAQYFPTSNEETKYRDIGDMLLRGNDSTTADVLVQKANGKRQLIKALRSTKFYGQLAYAPFYKNKMPVCKILNKSIGYVDMDQLKFDNVDSVMNLLRHTKAIIFDDRCYPPAAAQQLFKYLPLRPYVNSNLSGPIVDADIILNQYRDYSFETVRLYKDIPQIKYHKWTYPGKLVVLFNEWTQSQAEATAAKLKDCGAIGIGTHTAGANGDITNFDLPGSVNLTFSGHRSTMQRTGVIPEIKAEPTIKGVRAGKDEVLERAVSYLQTGK